MTQLKRNIIYTMDVALNPNPDMHKHINNVVLNNSDLFSLLCRNNDILPEEIQDFIVYKESEKPVERENKEKITKENAEDFLIKKNFKLDENGYLGNFATNYKMNRIWMKELDED